MSDSNAARKYPCANVSCPEKIERRRFGRRQRYCSSRCRKAANRQVGKPTNLQSDEKQDSIPNSPIGIIEESGDIRDTNRENVPEWAQVPDSPSNGHESASEGLDTFRWDRVNDITLKLVMGDKTSETPRSHGQWPGYRTSYAVAWVINVGWPAQKSVWIGRCRDRRGDWRIGPAPLDVAKAQTKNWLFGAPIEDGVEIRRVLDPIAELNSIQLSLMQPDKNTAQ